MTYWISNGMCGTKTHDIQQAICYQIATGRKQEESQCILYENYANQVTLHPPR